MISEKIAEAIFTFTQEDKSDLSCFYGLNIDYKNESIISSAKLAESGDIYEGIERLIESDLTLIWDTVAFTTEGWCKPVDTGDDTPPSKHPLKQRVILTVIVNKEKEFHAVMKIENGEILHDTSGRGPLADHAQKLYPLKMENF